LGVGKSWKDIGMRVGITGHQRLKPPADWGWVKSEVDKILSMTSHPLIGVSSLAIGADQLFANAVLGHDGLLEVIIPFPEYERTFDEGSDRQNYQGLLNRASKVDVLQRIGSDEECYFEAGKFVADRVDLLIAVWNGKPAAGLGGTGDIAKYAVQKQKRTIHLNPYTREVKELSE
jgi:hypothetical protein